MSLASKREYLERVWGRYERGGKEHKGKILDEFCQVYGCARKHAIRLFRAKPQARKKPGPAVEYGPEVASKLKHIWLSSDQLCSKRLKEALPIWLKHEAGLGSELKEKLLAISPAQIDRLLKPFRASYPGVRRRSKPGSLIAQQIPVRGSNEDIVEPGYLEVDTVAHGGESCSGDYIWSITFTDIHTGWTEVRANWNRTAHGVLGKVKELEGYLPFKIRGFDSDNGGEFINYGLYQYLKEKEIKFTRSRPYHKNDNPHVEQKNWTHVRQLLGEERLDHPELVPLIDDLFRNEWRQFQNFFRPTFKLKSKKRVKSKIRKEYEKPVTPYERVMASDSVSAADKEKLKKEYEAANPYKLKDGIEKKLKIIFLEVRRLNKEAGRTKRPHAGVGNERDHAAAASVQPSLRYGFTPAAAA
ncbi:MAG: integrase catalytic domain-containing protein [Verrucomicrobiales bacterium]